MRRLLPAASLLLLAAVPVPVPAPAPVHVLFQPHATFFSLETHQAKPLDPQVFVPDGAAAPGTGPQGIHHISGVRPALLGDPRSERLVNAKGTPLGFTLGQWLGAGGEATVTPSGNGALIAMAFHGLRPDAQYSLFENHFDQNPVGFTPLDGAGDANSFRSDTHGEAMVTVTTPAMPTHDNAILLVLDDAGKTYGMERGPIGIDVQHQLIARLP